MDKQTYLHEMKHLSLINRQLLAYFKQKEKDEENLEFIVKHQIGKINQLLDLAVKHIPNDNI